MSSPRQSCLIILTSATEGVCAQSFVQAFTLVHTTFSVQLASPGGQPVEYVNQDENSRRWLAEFRTKAFAIPTSLQSIDPGRYSALLIPNAAGAAVDLASDIHLRQILEHFVQEKKPICAVGLGVAALAAAKHEDGSWMFSNYCLTATSVFELARTPYFSSLPMMPEDFIKDSGATYSCSEADAVHFVLDRHLITAQNNASTLIATQNLILLCNQKKDKVITR